MGNSSSQRTTSASPPVRTATVALIEGASSTDVIRLVAEYKNTDYYEILGFERFSNPTQRQINSAFRQASLKFHPDKHCGSDEEHQKKISDIFLILGGARETLLDPKLKAAYDKDLKFRNWDMHEYFERRGRRVVAGLTLGVGLFCIAGSLCAVALPPLAVGLGVVGNALTTAGTTGVIRDVVNPNLSHDEFVGSMALGALGGAVLGGAAYGIAAACAPTAAVGSGAAAVGARVGVDVVAGTAAAGATATNAGAAVAGGVGAAIRGTTQLLLGLGTTGLVAGGTAAIADASSDLRPERIDRFCSEIVAVKTRSFYYKFLSDAASSPQPKPVSQHILQRLASKSEWRALGKELETYHLGHGFQAETCLKVYTLEAIHKEMNTALEGGVRGIVGMWYFGAYIHNLRMEMKLRGRFYNKPEPLWRGTNLSEKQLETWARQGEMFLIPTFMSASKDRSVSEGFLELRKDDSGCPRALLKIDCSKNLGEWGYTYAVEIEDISKFPHEKEVLFYPYSGFLCTGASCEDGVHIIELQTLDTLMVDSGAV